ncbi:MAG: hypothetical protein K9J30_12020 [Bacteroidales bacterium]|nr:hypothetical protein [Bacteroidales bacterium]
MMKKYVPFILVLLSLHGLTSAQERSWKKGVLIHTGISIPFSNYASKTMENYYSGYFANPGANLGTDLLWYGKIFGLGASLGYANQTFAREAFRSEYDRILNGEGETTVSAGIYQSLKGTAGLILKTPEFYNTEIMFTAQAGMALIVHPEITVENSFWGTLNTINTDSDWQPMSMMEVIVKYRMTEKIGISLIYNSNYAKPYFTDDTGFYNGFNVPVRFRNVNIGILINF